MPRGARLSFLMHFGGVKCACSFKTQQTWLQHGSGLCCRPEVASLLNKQQQAPPPDVHTNREVIGFSTNLHVTVLQFKSLYKTVMTAVCNTASDAPCVV